MRPLAGRPFLVSIVVLATVGAQSCIGRADPLAPPRPAKALVRTFLATLGGAAPASFVDADVPTVGCPADGQQGPAPAPKLPARIKARIPAGQQDRLAYYKADATGGVLAPRGWTCFGVYGSSGDSIVVAPAGSDPKLFSVAPPEIRGEAVTLSHAYGSTSGRFTVAAVSARIFPAARAFVDGVRREDIAPRGDFVFSPWRADTLHRLSDRAVAYLTPAHAAGLGDAAAFAAADLPILGVAYLTGERTAPDLIVLRVRLGADMDLYPGIAVNALPSEGDSGK